MHFTVHYIMVQQVLSVTSPKYCFWINTFIKKIRPLVQPLEFYLKLVLSSFTVIFCFRFAISYHPHDPLSYNIKVDTCVFLLHNGALWDICLMHCGICETVLLKTIRRYASVNQHGVPQYTYLSQRLQIFFAMCTYTFLKTKTNPRYELGMYLFSQHAFDCEMVEAKARRDIQH